MNVDVKKYSKIAIWFLKRPFLYPEAIRRIKNIVFRTHCLPARQEEAKAYCQKIAISTKAAYTLLTGQDTPTSVYKIFPEIFKQSKQKEKKCPIKLGKAGDLDLLYWLAEFVKAKYVIETGVASGWSTLALLLSLSRQKESKLISTDMPCFGQDAETEGLSSDSYVGYVVPSNLQSNWKLIRQADHDALPKALKICPQIDLCHYDSDKRYEGRMWSYPLLWSALREGGIFISDDIGDNMAFFDFCDQIQKEPVIIKFVETNKNVKYIGVIRKQ